MRFLELINENEQLIAKAMEWAKDSYGELMFGHKPEDFEWTFNRTFPVSEFGDKEEWIDLFGREREAVKFRARKGNKRAEQELADWQDIVQTGARKPVMALKYPERKGTAGGYEILDGYHRIGATFTSGRPTLPAVIGVIRPKINEAWVPPDAARYAAGFEDNSSVAKANEVDWEYDATFPLDMFINSKSTQWGTMNQKQWAEWYHREVKDFRQDQGHDIWGNLEHEEIEEPVVAVFTDDGWDLWDGWHRVGASIAAGRTTVPAVVGTLKPGGIDEAHNVPSAMSIEFTCGACMFFAYVLNRKFGWPISGTFMASPVRDDQGMPGEISSMDDYEKERVAFGHAWVQPTDNIAVDIEGATTTEKTKARWAGYPYTYVKNIDPEWMGQFLKGRLNSATRRGIWKRAMQAAKMLRPHLKDEGLLERFNEAQGQLLYHGTNVWNLANIIASDTLREGVHWGRTNEPHGPRFSRSLELGRSFTEYASPDWPIGGVLAVDYNRLAADYKLIDYQDVDVAGEPWADEQEVAAITKGIQPLSKYLTGIECSMEVIEQAMSEEGLEFAIHGFGYMDNEEQAIAALKQLAAHPLLNKGVM